MTTQTVERTIDSPELAALIKEAKKDGIDFDDPNHAVVFAAFVVGPNADRIAKFLNRPREWVRPTARACREKKLWIGEAVEAEAFDTLNIILQVLVLEGLFEIVAE